MLPALWCAQRRWSLLQSMDTESYEECSSVRNTPLVPFKAMGLTVLMFGTGVLHGMAQEMPPLAQVHGGGASFVG